jgi:hypothetical protein
MNRRKTIQMLTLAPTAAAQAQKAGVHDRFIGVWKLVSCESKDKTSGEVRYPYGKNPVGRITYDAAGRMSAQLMNPGRKMVGGPPSRSSRTSIREASLDDMREILNGFMAYYGTFDVDEAARTVIHHVQASLLPSWVGSDQRRQYEFLGTNRLILTASSEQTVTRLVWERDAT